MSQHALLTKEVYLLQNYRPTCGVVGHLFVGIACLRTVVHVCAWSAGKPSGVAWEKKTYSSSALPHGSTRRGFRKFTGYQGTIIAGLRNNCRDTKVSPNLLREKKSNCAPGLQVKKLNVTLLAHRVLYRVSSKCSQ